MNRLRKLALWVPIIALQLTACIPAPPPRQTATPPPRRTVTPSPEPTEGPGNALPDDHPLRACESLFRFDEAMAGNNPSLPIMWTFSVNFKVFENGDPTRPIGCLKVYERVPPTGGGASYRNAVQTDFEVAPDAVGIPIVCQASAPLKMITPSQTFAHYEHELPGASGAYQPLPVAAVEFDGASQPIACTFDLRMVIEENVVNKTIVTDPTISAKLDKSYEYPNFAIGAAGLVREVGEAVFLSREPDRAACGSEIGVGLPACEAATQTLTKNLGPVQLATSLNGSTLLTPLAMPVSGVSEAIEMGDDCDLSNALGKPLIWWSYLGDDLGVSPPARNFFHYVYDTTNTNKLARCIDKEAAPPAAVSFFTGPATIFIGATPTVAGQWEGELYEVIIDPPGGSPGSDGAK